MKADKNGWPRRYRAALSKYLDQGPGASLRPALGLGRRAVALGLKTLDLARFHEQALMVLAPDGVSSRAGRRTIERAKRFFAETTVPVENSHRAALNAGIRVERLTKTLRRRTAELSASTRRLKRSVIQRRAVEDAVKKRGKQHARLLAEARRQQKRLRRLARKSLTAQENEREKMSRRLNDEIAQALLGVDVSLVSLKKRGKSNEESLKKEIANTQRPVRESVKRVKRFSHEFTCESKT